MSTDADALVIGAGPAGASTAILLANSGWRVILVEQHVFPRQKVCGECLTAGCLALLDELGVGRAVIDRAGPELRQVGWMSRSPTIIADLPSCLDGPYRYGRALGRDQLDALLLKRARELGVTIVQPAKVRTVSGGPGGFECVIDASDGGHAYALEQVGTSLAVRVAVVVDAHGSWEAGPDQGKAGAVVQARAPRRSRSDLFGFKASFCHATLPRGLLPVLAFRGGYGGIVVAEGGRLTLAGCIRRDTLRAWRARMPGVSAGLAMEEYLRYSCPEVGEVLARAQRIGPWLSIGPVRPGIRVSNAEGPFRVGNAAGETHPLIGEGMSMALQSAFLLTSRLIEQPALAIDSRRSREIDRGYDQAWRNAFAPRLRFAAIYAHIAMHPALGVWAGAFLRRWPQLLTEGARLAGKARRTVGAKSLCEAAP